MNEITIVGNLTADPIYRVAERNARGVVHFDVAVNRRRFNRESNQYDDLPPVYHRVVAFGPLADNVNESLQRGLEVVVVGSFADDSYEKDGEKRRQQVLEGPGGRRQSAVCDCRRAEDAAAGKFSRVAPKRPSQADRHQVPDKHRDRARQ
jgi:single-strand DNA-binding protein